MLTISPGQTSVTTSPFSSCKIKLGSGSSSISITPWATSVELQITLLLFKVANSNSQHPGSSISEYGILKSSNPSPLMSWIQEL